MAKRGSISVGVWCVCCLALAGGCGDDDGGGQDQGANAQSAEADSGAGQDAVADAGDGDGDGNGSRNGDTTDDGDTTGDTITGSSDIPDNPDGVDALPTLPADVTLPIVFVHGFAGSAQQFESQAMRFTSNGYPQELIYAYDHDGQGIAFAEYVAGTEAMVDAALAASGAEQVYLVGHSRGTSVSTTFLSDAARAAKVAKYVALDGAPCPAAVPCIAPNQAGLPGQSHVEVATSKETFAMMYEFFVGEAPEVVDVVAQRAPVTISGRAVNFPANTGRDGVTLELWEVDPATGERATSKPQASFQIGADGEWGPAVVDSTKYYEQVLYAEEDGPQHHIYGQRFLRDDHLVRQLSSDSDGPSAVNANATDNHANIISIRMREWYAMDDPDNEGDESDVLEISTKSEAGDQEPVNAIVDFVGNGTIGLHIHDDAATPGETTLEPLPYFSEQPFQSGIDVFMPAADPPNGVITVTSYPRGDKERPQTLHVPNWASSNHTIGVVFADFPVE